MAHYVATVRTDRSAEEVFAYMADLRNFAEWDPGVERAEQVAGDGPGPAAEFDVAVSAPRGPLTLRYRTVEYEPPTSVVVKAQTKLLTSLDTITVRPDGKGALVTYDAVLNLNGIARLGDPLLALSFKRIAERAAAGLVAQLEGTRVDAG
jgi:carbon monoxide dehydrogenase subunit G